LKTKPNSDSGGKQVSYPYSGNGFDPNNFLYKLIVQKKGERDNLFDEFAHFVLDQLVRNQVYDGATASLISAHIDKYIVEIAGLTIFSLDIHPNLSDDTRKKFDEMKHALVSRIATDASYRGYRSFCAIHYSLSDKEKGSLGNLTEVIANVNSMHGRLGIDVFVDNLGGPSEVKEVLSEYNRLFDLDYYFEIALHFSTKRLDKKFFGGVKKLSDYLHANKIIQRPLDVDEIRDSFEESKENAIKCYGSEREVDKVFDEYVFAIALSGIYAGPKESKLPRDFIQRVSGMLTLEKHRVFLTTHNLRFSTYSCYQS